MALVLKHYYMKEIEREKYEKRVLDLKPELDVRVFELDDYEIRDLLERLNDQQFVVNNQLLIS